MSLPKFNTETREQAKNLIASLDRKGWPHARIAVAVGAKFGVTISLPLVTYYLKRIKAEYRKARVEETAVLVNEKLAQYRSKREEIGDLRAEAMRAWERSLLAGDEEDGIKAGEVAFLRTMLDANRAEMEVHKAECDLLGLDAPKKVEGTFQTLDWTQLLLSQAGGKPVDAVEAKIAGLLTATPAQDNIGGAAEEPFVPPGATHKNGDSYWGNGKGKK